MRESCLRWVFHNKDQWHASTKSDLIQVEGTNSKNKKKFRENVGRGSEKRHSRQGEHDSR